MTNVIENAVQVMENGHLWINTEDVHDMQSHVRFCIGNPGSQYTRGGSANFQLFFTGKSRRTGFGSGHR
jgi:hypothetical protein